MLFRSEAVAVAYADWHAAGSPAPDAIIVAAAAAGCRTLLIDTYDKSAAGLFELPAADRLPEWIGRARAAGLSVALAGRLHRGDIPRAATLGADVVAVRSAACRGGRSGRVDRRLVAAARAALGDPAATLPSSARDGSRSPECSLS